MRNAYAQFAGPKHKVRAQRGIVVDQKSKKKRGGRWKRSVKSRTAPAGIRNERIRGLGERGGGEVPKRGGGVG